MMRISASEGNSIDNLFELSAGTYRIDATTNAIRIIPLGSAQVIESFSRAKVAGITASLDPMATVSSPDNDIIGLVLMSRDFEFSIDELIKKRGVLRSFLTSEDVGKIPTTKKQVENNKAFVDGRAMALVPDMFLESTGTTATFTNLFFSEWNAILTKWFPSPTDPNRRILNGAAVTPKGNTATVYVIEVAESELKQNASRIFPIA
jgi:hypothetical protein